MAKTKEGIVVRANLNGRQRNELHDLSKAVDGILVADMMSKYKISRRSVYYDIEKIHQWLSSEGLGHISVVNQVPSDKCRRYLLEPAGALLW